MALVKLTNFEANDQDSDEVAIQDFSIYAEGGEKMGSVEDLLVDEVTGQFRYLIVDLGFWIFGKKVLLPVGRVRFDQHNDRFYAVGLTKDQAEQLPEFNQELAIDSDYEASIRRVYDQNPTSLRVASQAPTTKSQAQGSKDSTALQRDREAYNYEHDPALYAMNDQDHQLLKLYEERVIAKHRAQKEVSLDKPVEPETTQVPVPVTTEHLVISHSESPSRDSLQADFQEGEVARIEIFEEIPDIRKEIFVREEVSIRKVTDHKIVNVEEAIRRETLDVKVQGQDVVDYRS